LKIAAVICLPTHRHALKPTRKVPRIFPHLENPPALAEKPPASPLHSTEKGATYASIFPCTPRPWGLHYYDGGCFFLGGGATIRQKPGTRRHSFNFMTLSGFQNRIKYKTAGEMEKLERVRQLFIIILKLKFPTRK